MKREMQDAPVNVVLLVNAPLEILRACVESIERSIPEPYQLSLVSKGELSSETEDFIRSLSGARNLSAATAPSLSALYNLGIQSSDSEFVVFLDSYALPADGWFQSLSAAMQSDSRIGAVGSLCVDSENQSILHAGIELAEDDHPLYCCREQFFEYLQPEALPIYPIAVQTNGLMLRRTALAQAGYFAENYSEEYHDIDLCLRIWAAGYKVALSTGGALFHREKNSEQKLLHRRANLETLRQTINSSPALKGLVERRRVQPAAADGATPLVSVLYPAFNDEVFLAQNIDSIINQTYRNWELIVVNDASTDATADILRRYQEAYPEKIRVIEKEHHNRYDAWDMLYVAARGKYLCAIGADDIFLPEKLGLQVQLMEAQPSLSFVHSDIYRFDEQGSLINYQRAGDHSPERQLVRLLEWNYVSTPAVLMSKEAIEDSGGWMKREFLYAQDYDLWLRLLKGGAESCIHEPLVKYRIHRWQLTQVAGPEKMLNSINLVVQEKLKRWEPEHLFPSWDLHSEQGIKAFYKEAEVIGFPGQFGHANLQASFLDFLKPVINRNFSSRSVRRARTEFLYRVSDYFLRDRKHRLAAIYALTAVGRDPLCVLAFIRLLSRRLRRNLSESMKKGVPAT